ncbi:MAG: glycosyltransferase [Oceanicaulis sp.]
MVNAPSRVVGPDWIKQPCDRVKDQCDALAAARTWPKITVVTPAFRSAAFIRDTIESVRLQHYPNLEYIVADACSDDGTEEILAQYDFLDARIEPDEGQADALNKAFKTASGDILTWLNADDLFAPLALFRMAEAFERHDADLIAGQAIIFNERGPLVRHTYGLPDGPLIEREILDLKGMWNTGQYFYQPEVFFTRAIYEAAGGHVDASLHYSMDYDLWVRMAQAGARVAGVGAPIVLFRKHEAQKTADPAKFNAELSSYIERHAIKQAAPSRYADQKFDGRRSPRVLMVNDFGFQYGAGIGHGRYAASFRLLGCEVEAFKIAEDVGEHNYEFNPDFERLVATAIKGDYDLAVVGNIHGATRDLNWLWKLAEQVEVWIATHDFYFLTGRCAYFGDCSKYLDARCDAACPTFFEYPMLEPDKIARAARAKRDLLAHPNVRILANSHYAAQKFRDAFMARGFIESEIEDKVLVAELGVSVDAFQASRTEKAEARAALGLPLDKHLVLLPSGDYTDPRKNSALALRLFAQLDPDRFHAVMIGATKTPVSQFIRNVSQLYYTKDREQLALLFKSADFAVNTSFDETFGQTLVEAALAGAVPVSIGRGAAPEVVARLGSTIRPEGAGDAAALQAAIAFINQLAASPARLAGEQARVALAAANAFSLEASARRLHLAMKQSGLVTRRGLRGKIDLFAAGDEPPVELLGEWAPERLAALDGRIDELVEQLERAQAAKDWYKAAFLQMIEELRHEDGELAAFHQSSGLALYQEAIEALGSQAPSIAALAAHLRRRLRAQAAGGPTP